MAMDMAARIKQLEAELAQAQALASSAVRVTKSKAGDMVCICGLRSYPFAFYPSEALKAFEDTVVTAVRALATEMVPFEAKEHKPKGNGKV